MKFVKSLLALTTSEVLIALTISEDSVFQVWEKLRKLKL